MTELAVSFRRLARSPGYVAAVVASLAVGIAVCVAAFSLVNIVVFDEVVGIQDRTSLIRVAWTNQGGPFTTAEFEALERQRPPAFTSVAAHGERSLPVLLPSGPATLTVGLVSAHFFETLGTRPVAGRLLDAADADRGATPVAVIAEELWRGPFNGANDVVGRSMLLGGRAFTIVGVAPAGSPGLRPVDLGTRDMLLPQVWVNLTHAVTWRATNVTLPWLLVAGRLSPEASLKGARAQIESTAAWIRTISPIRERIPVHERASLIIFRAGLDWRDEPAQSLLTLVVFLFVPVSVLLIACVNVMSLQLARAFDQAGELSVRLALGASRARLMRLMSVEVAIVSMLSGLAGWTGARFLLLRMSAYLPTEMVADKRVLAWAVGVGVLVVASAGIVPAWLTSNRVVAAGLRSLDDGPPRMRGRSVLLTLQVAASITLLALSGLALRSLVGRSPHLSANASRILLLDLNLANVRTTDPRTDQFAASVLDSLRAKPSIHDAAFATFAIAGNSLTFALPADSPGTQRVASGGFVTPRWFDATDATFLVGQGFEGRPELRSQAVINASLASTLARSGARALGTQLRRPSGEIVEVVGVIADTQRRGTGEPMPMMFLPMPALPPPSLTLVARTHDVASARRVIDAAIRAADPLVPIGRIESLDVRTAEHFRGFRELTSYGFALGLLALGLTAAGLHALLSYIVRRRTREIGIRLAIGASIPRVVWIVVRPALCMVVVGTTVGLAVAVPIARVMRAALAGLSPLDVVSLIPSLVLLGAIAVIATGVPALRAARVDPAQALRQL